MKKREYKDKSCAGYDALERVLVEAAKREPIADEEQSAWILQDAKLAALHSPGRMEALVRGLSRRTVHDIATEPRVTGKLMALSTKLAQSTNRWVEERKLAPHEAPVAPWDPKADEIDKSWKFPLSGEPNG